MRVYGAKPSNLPTEGFTERLQMLGIDPTEYFKDVLLRARLRAATPAACADLTPLQWKIARAK